MKFEPCSLRLQDFELCPRPKNRNQGPAGNDAMGRSSA